ncbi:MAG: tetratricopeptide repeat protein [Gammaproteobacteria bacterium]
MISKRARDVYLLAANADDAERETLLNVECGDDASLLAEVHSLLEAAGPADAYFDSLSQRIGLSALAGDDDSIPSQAVGPWRLLSLLGRGGMGAVYLAERTDQHYEQQVALKLLPLGANSDTARARFLSERQILARLSHDNIARLVDGGITDDGSPWFAMDYVQGAPLDQYCDEHGLGVDARLSLLLKVMRAVQYAHGNLVVHRDIKPANVMVDVRDQVRLLDFGIAKVLEPHADDLAHTQLAQRPVTPAYASPEMLRGEAVDVTTDVYSLGVLMYHLLTGELPLTFDDMTLPAMHAHAAHGAPVPMSARRPDLGTDLQAIAFKALAKDPAHRYSSVEAMATDLERYLDGLPIQAQPPSAWRRARLFARRHRVGLGFAGFAALALLSLAGVSFNAAITSDQQAARIALERDKAEQTKSFLQSIFELSGPNQSKGLTITARELLDEGATNIRSQLTTQPAIRAELLSTLAQIYLELSALPEAARLFEEAGELYAVLPRDGQAGLANTHYKRALIAERQGQYVDAETLAIDAENLFRALSDEANLARTFVTLGRVMQRQGRLDEAQSRFDEALSMHQRLHGNVHIDIARDLLAHGSLQMHRGEYDKAQDFYEQALALRNELFGNDDVGRIELAHNLSQVLIFQSKHDEALAILNEGVLLSQRLLPEGNSGLFYLYNGLADIHRRRGELDLAEQRFGDALDVLNRFFDADHQEHAMVRAQLGRLLLLRGDAAQAEPLLREGIERIKRTNPGFPFLPDMNATLGKALLELGRLNDAKVILRGSVEKLSDTVGETHPRAQSAMATLLKIYEAAGDEQEAERIRSAITTSE